MVLKNESYWEEIERQSPFQKENQHYDECWEALEAFQKDAAKQLNAVSLITLAKLLSKVYTAGYSAGHNAAEYNDT